jgi:hypothetical protein
MARKLPKILLNFFHSGDLIHMEWTPPVTVTTFDTKCSIYFQFSVVLLRQMITRHSQIIIFIDQSNIKSYQAWLAMIAVYAVPLGLLRGKGSDLGIVLLLIGCLTEIENPVQIMLPTA